jgi:hypothetical protein
MLLFELIAEQKIREAIERGELDDLPGQGRPLDLTDDRLVPEELRMAYRLLKNAGFVPPESPAGGSGAAALNVRPNGFLAEPIYDNRRRSSLLRRLVL